MKVREIYNTSNCRKYLEIKSPLDFNTDNEYEFYDEFRKQCKRSYCCVVPYGANSYVDSLITMSKRKGLSDVTILLKVEHSPYYRLRVQYIYLICNMDCTRIYGLVKHIKTEISIVLDNKGMIPKPLQHYESIVDKQLEIFPVTKRNENTCQVNYTTYEWVGVKYSEGHKATVDVLRRMSLKARQGEDGNTEYYDDFGNVCK